VSTVSFTLTPPADFLNMNENLHWAVKSPRVKAWRAAGCAAIRAGFNPYHFDRAHITVAIRFPDNVVRDVGNYYPTAKAIVDGCVDARLLANDDDLHVIGPDMRRIYPNGDPEVTVTIEETP
jgi:hypothetical protein